MYCLNCRNTKVCDIADGLCLCSECEKTERFHLVRDVYTKKMYWKNVKWAIVDEELC